MSRLLRPTETLRDSKNVSTSSVRALAMKIISYNFSRVVQRSRVFVFWNNILCVTPTEAASSSTLTELIYFRSLPKSNDCRCEDYFYPCSKQNVSFDEQLFTIQLRQRCETSRLVAEYPGWPLSSFTRLCNNKLGIWGHILRWVNALTLLCP